MWNKYTPMISDSIIILILGSALTLTASLTSLLAKSYVDEKQRDKDRFSERIENITGNVYSPLLFIVFEVDSYLGDFRNDFARFYSLNAPKENIDLLKVNLKEKVTRFRSDSIKDLLLTKIGFIEPIHFGKNLFLYFQALNHFENGLKQFVNTDIIGDITKERNWLINMSAVCSGLALLNARYLVCLEALISERGLEDSSLEKLGTTTTEILQKIHSLRQLR
jgi:hypothetical protein